jgi:hypothetical protein
MNVHREGFAVFSGEFLRTFSDKKEGRTAFFKEKSLLSFIVRSGDEAVKT